MANRSAKSKRQPWDQPAPRGSRQTKLTKSQKAKAKAAATRAGRRYPNLVDNMRVAAGGKRKKRGKKS
jgi:hypothetical protein